MNVVQANVKLLGLPSLKDVLVVERGIGGGDEVGKSVVLSEPHGVHRLQAGVLVGAGVAREELILKAARDGVREEQACVIPVSLSSRLHF